MKLWGVDYGAKTAGTTAVACLEVDSKSVWIQQSKPKKDADEFLQTLFETHRPELIGMDAPLSLPGKFRHLDGYSDYMYRKSDRELGAMSPMFLGGLTARAMRLAEIFENGQSLVIEVYPGGLIDMLFPDEKGYKKKDTLNLWIPLIRRVFSPIQIDTPANWHQFDALLALQSAWRFWNDKNKSFGTREEGIIYI